MNYEEYEKFMIKRDKRERLTRDEVFTDYAKPEAYMDKPEYME